MAIVMIMMAMATSCAPADYTPHEYGFFGGLLHGAVFPLALTGKILGAVLNFLNDSWGNWDIGMFADNNSGFTYWMGYVFGFMWLSPLFTSR